MFPSIFYTSHTRDPVDTFVRPSSPHFVWSEEQPEELYLHGSLSPATWRAHPCKHPCQGLGGAPPTDDHSKADLFALPDWLAIELQSIPREMLLYPNACAFGICESRVSAVTPFWPILSAIFGDYAIGGRYDRYGELSTSSCLNLSGGDC